MSKTHVFDTYSREYDDWFATGKLLFTLLIRSQSTFETQVFLISYLNRVSYRNNRRRCKYQRMVTDEAVL